ncbi:MAG: hypothetical protein EOO28_00715 [Comamonadaceae bacterium]|nr:MAG: hypothetical protein EOO28_00715 [Comamonadaceae bacterium]
MTDITIPGQVPSLPSRPPPLMTTVMTPASQTKGVRVDVDVLYLDDIPKAMDKMGWTVSAQLMRRWFATRPAYVMPSSIRGGITTGHNPINYELLPKSQVEDQIVKMNWLLEYESALQTFEELCQGWNTPSGILKLHERLTRMGWSSGKSIKLGSKKMTALQLDVSAQVNRRIFGEYSDVFDDLYGAIFKATMKLASVGKAARSWISKRDVFEIDSMGIYIRDTYDFNVEGYADQLYGLGIWSRERLLTKRETLIFKSSTVFINSLAFPGFVSVKNSDFSRWQKQRNEGWDFFLFSDVKWVTPNVEYVVL